jgi:thioesterase domain-containing protein/acyl carrier protein
MEVSIKDEMGALAPRGEIGEIVVRSRFLSQGYWNNPDLTAKVFQTDPLDSAVRIYRTGDLGRWRRDGTLEHVGRKGRTIRLRGYDIEPFQVECELMRQPGVADAIVLLHDDAAAQKQCLVGYVIAPPNTSPSVMREALSERLPSYMVPSHIVVLDNFPIASSGKIDRNALPPPHLEKPRSVVIRAPSDEQEHELLAIWQEVLKISNIGIDDDFFELGGDSLQALTVFMEIEARLGCSLSPTTLMQAPTVARLAEFIRTSKEIGALVTLRHSGTGLPLFLVSWNFILGGHYRHLLCDLKSDRPVFGLQPPPLDGRHSIPRTIESMAAAYVKEIRQAQPHGPYSLAGHSFGGRVSFEIAQQLVREGERVSFLGLIDTVGGVTPIERRSWVLHYIEHTNYMDRIRSPILDVWCRLRRSIPYKYRPTYWRWLIYRANRAYVLMLKPFPGHITFFSSAGNSERRREYWSPLAGGGLTVLEVPAHHDHMVSPPHSKLVAEHIDACLDAAALRE